MEFGMVIYLTLQIKLITDAEEHEKKIFNIIIAKRVS